jgi:NAD(P)-dependent dehydrogenase (short-subunit alcohol dehydrogenase family)
MLEGNIAVVTGAGRGIGKAIAKQFAAQGASVVVAARSGDEIEGTVSEIRGAGGNAVSVSVDIADKSSVENLAAVAKQTYGRIDILVCNASTFESVPFLAMSDEVWQRMLQVNLTGTYYCIKAVLPQMVERKYGRVITISSIIGKVGLPFYAAYSASKHGIIGLTKCVAREVAKLGITANVICPGIANTAMKEQFVSQDSKHLKMTEQQYVDFLKHVVPLGRFLEPEEVATLACYFASKEAAGMTGQAVNICGGAGTY